MTARLLDVTRSVRRAGQRPTGVDRVEMAYFRHFARDTLPLFVILRTRPGYLLLDENAARRLFAALGKQNLDRRSAERHARALACGRAVPPLLGAMLRRHLPPGTAYFNVGHSNLRLGVMRVLRRACNARSYVLLHDAIPLDHPEFQRPSAPRRFIGMLRAAERGADAIIYNSQHSRARIEAHMRATPPKAMVVHLGSDPLPRAPAATTANTPTFLCLGTIEPRKNHGFLLDLWDDLIRTPPATGVPRLILCGARGWRNAAVFARLDALPTDGPVREVTGADDGEVSALLATSRALLFPSHSEGFGLPPAEAAALGVPVLAPPLPALREHLNDYPTWLAPAHLGAWRAEIIRLSLPSVPFRQTPYPVANWSEHFKVVLNLR